MQSNFEMESYDFSSNSDAKMYGKGSGVSHGFSIRPPSNTTFTQQTFAQNAESYDFSSNSDAKMYGKGSGVSHG